MTPDAERQRLEGLLRTRKPANMRAFMWGRMNYVTFDEAVKPSWEAPMGVLLTVQERDEIADALDAAEATIVGAHKSITHLSQQAHLEWTRADQAEARATAAETERDELRELVQAIHTSTREDHKGEQWTIRAFLDKRGVFNDNMSGSRRLVAEACQSVLGRVPTGTTEA